MEINIVVQIPIHSGSSSIVCNNCNMWEVQEEASWHSLKFSQVRTIGWNFYLVQLSVPGIVSPSLSDPIVQHQHYCHLHLGPKPPQTPHSHIGPRIYLLITGSHSLSSFHRWHVSEKYVPVLVTTDSLTERPPPPPWQRPKWQIDQIFSSVTQKIFSLLDLDTVRVSSFKSQNVNWKFENSFLNSNSTSKLQLYWENSQLGQLQVWF